MQFFRDLLDPSMLFLLYSTLIGVLSSFAFGIIGTFVVIKRIGFIAGSISHCILGGIGLGLYLQKVVGITWFTPVIGSMLMAILAAVLIGIFTLYYREREDTLIGALWAFGMAIGLILIHYTPGYHDPMSYLFGSILMVGPSDLITIIVIDLIIILITVLLYNKLVAICFDEEFAKLRGINTKAHYLLLLVLIAMTIVTLINIVGIVMIIALMTIPAGIAGFFSRNIRQMIIYSIIICFITILLGLVTSYTFNLPTGPTIILINSMIYFSAMMIRRKIQN